ncbi:hypothetical protein V6N13_044082 [Hibiscus sabdariffa]
MIFMGGKNKEMGWCRSCFSKAHVMENWLSPDLILRAADLNAKAVKNDCLPSNWPLSSFSVTDPLLLFRCFDEIHHPRKLWFKHGASLTRRSIGGCYRTGHESSGGGRFRQSLVVGLRSLSPFSESLSLGVKLL